MKHAAIPTVYKGIQMRSRLEARWAAFFDACDLKWAYEPIDLKGWIPDFVVYLDGVPEGRVLVEIKPLHDIDQALCVELSKQTVSSGEGLSIWLMGVHPSSSCCFVGEYTCCGDDGYLPFHKWTRFVFDNNAEELATAWINAGNVTQWKSPRQMMGKSRKKTLAQRFAGIPSK